MKSLSIILTCALLGVIGWLIFDSRSEANKGGAQNQLDQLRRQQAGTPADEQIAALESKLMAEQMSKKAPAPTVGVPAPVPAPRQSVPGPIPSATVGSTPAVTAAIQAANAAPLQPTPRQRLIASLPPLSEVKLYAKDYGFVEIKAGAESKIEPGMGFAIRRGNSIIARVKVTSVENESAVADVDSRSLPPGVLIETGDEVIQDLPPES